MLSQAEAWRRREDALTYAEGVCSHAWAPATVDKRVKAGREVTAYCLQQGQTGTALLHMSPEDVLA